jgi:hypothetical protein
LAVPSRKSSTYVPLTLLSLNILTHSHLISTLPLMTHACLVHVCRLSTTWRSTDSTAPPSRDRVGVVVPRTRWTHLWLRQRDCGDRSQSVSACSACDGDTRRQWLPCDGGLHVRFVCSSVPLLVLACNRIGPADVAKCRPRLSSRALGPSVNTIYYCLPLRFNPLVGRSHLDVSVAWSLVCVKPSDPFT